MFLYPCWLMRLLQMFLHKRFLLVLSEIVLNTWAPQLILSPWESLPHARELQTCIPHEPSVWQNGGLGIFRMKLLSKKNHFHQHVCDTEQSHVEQWPCQVIAGESSYFSLLHNTLSPKLLAINLPFYWVFWWVFFPQMHFMGWFWTYLFVYMIH